MMLSFARFRYKYHCCVFETAWKVPYRIDCICEQVVVSCCLVGVVIVICKQVVVSCCLVGDVTLWLLCLKCLELCVSDI